MRPFFGFRVPPESCPTQPSPPAAADGPLSWAFVPFSTPGVGGPPDAGLPARYVPPSGFGDPLDGLLPPSPCRLCFTPAALLGFTLRSFLLAKGIRRVSAGMNPPTVSPVGDPAAEAMGRPNGPRFLGFHPSESPWRPSGVYSPAAGCSLGFLPLRVSRRAPCPGFRPNSFLALRRVGRIDRPHRRPGVSMGIRLAPRRTARQAGRKRQGNPFRVSAPVRTRMLEETPARAMSSPHIAPCIAADRPIILGRAASLYRSHPGVA